MMGSHMPFKSIISFNTFYTIITMTLNWIPIDIENLHERKFIMNKIIHEFVKTERIMFSCFCQVLSK